MEKYEIIKNIAKRSGGDIYLGVVGAVRSGKSTFIKNFMDLLVIPNIDNDYKKERILLQIENLVYDRDYIIKSLKSNFLNHATTIYFLLINYEEI